MKKKQTKITVTISAVTPDRRWVQKTVPFIKDSCRYYHNAQHLLLQLDRGERAFYDYICEHMDGSNNITIDSALGKGFIEFIERVTSKRLTYSTSSVPQYTQKLLGLGLILKAGSGNSGYYVVNPKYAYSGTEVARQALLKHLIEDRIQNGQSIAPLINEPEQAFFADARTA